MEVDLHLLQSPLKTTTFRMRFISVLDQLLSVKSKNFDLKNLTTTTTTTKSQQTSTRPSSAWSLQAVTVMIVTAHIAAKHGSFRSICQVEKTGKRSVWEFVLEASAQLLEPACHMASHRVTWYPAEATSPALTPSVVMAGTQFIYQ